MSVVCSRRPTQRTVQSECDRDTVTTRINNALDLTPLFFLFSSILRLIVFFGAPLWLAPCSVGVCLAPPPLSIRKWVCDKKKKKASNKTSNRYLSGKKRTKSWKEEKKGDLIYWVWATDCPGKPGQACLLSQVQSIWHFFSIISVCVVYVCVCVRERPREVSSCWRVRVTLFLSLWHLPLSHTHWVSLLFTPVTNSDFILIYLHRL